jgi:hypothetical protein
LHTGSPYSLNGIVEFAKQLLAQLPHDYRLVFRADSGFFVGALMDLLDDERQGHLEPLGVPEGERLPPQRRRQVAQQGQSAAPATSPPPTAC